MTFEVTNVKNLYSVQVFHRFKDDSVKLYTANFVVVAMHRHQARVKAVDALVADTAAHLGLMIDDTEVKLWTKDVVRIDGLVPA